MGIYDSLCCDQEIKPAHHENLVIVEFRKRYDFGNFPLHVKFSQQIIRNTTMDFPCTLLNLPRIKSQAIFIFV
jgi:hypothetical protein